MLPNAAKIRTLLLVAAATVLAAALPAQQPKPEVDPSDALVKWDTQCMPRGCMLMTDVLRGYSDDPPRPKDDREYISLMVAIDRTTRKPAFFAFHVDPRAQQPDGIFIAFTKTVPDGKGWKMEIDKGSTHRLPFTTCDKTSCVARIGEGIACDENGKPDLDLLAKFEDSSSALLLYIRDGHAYRTMVLLSSFKKTYQHLLDNELATPPATPHP
jgi:hypothetical protein